MPALGGASAQPLRFLDFLIRNPVWSVMLHRSGVSVVVPAPERYAVHKLIVASRRLDGENGHLKREKDVRRASLLAEALITTGRQSDLADAYAEAWERGSSWKTAMMDGLSQMRASQRDDFQAGLLVGFKELGMDPTDYGLDARAGPSP